MTTSPIDGRTTVVDTAVAGPVPVPRGRDQHLPVDDRLLPEPPATTRPPLRFCRCGHEEEAHEHYRSGHDCGVCGSVRCRSFRLRSGRRARSSARR